MTMIEALGKGPVDFDFMIQRQTDAFRMPIENAGVRWPEKLSPFECGFAPFDDARGQFDVRFYLVAILFIIFDLEVAFLFPWAVALGDIGLFGFWSMMLFLAVLTVGFIYEWRKGALEWE